MKDFEINHLNYDPYDFISQLTFLPKCPFCASYPKTAAGHNFGKVYCSNKHCNLHSIYFYPNEWNKRA